MTLLDRLESALRSAWLPLVLLLLALSTVFVFGGDRGRFYRPYKHNGISLQHLTIAVNISPEHGFQRFYRWYMDDDGVVRYTPYNRFPIGGYVSMKVATLPFGESPDRQLYAARILMLLFFAGAAVLAYLSLCRLVSNRWIALTAVLLSFSSYYLLYFNDMTANEGMPDFFGVMLAFHGMVVFVQEGRFRQLLVKTCIALLLGWHVFALLLPFVIIGLANDLLRARSAAVSSTLPGYVKLKQVASALIRSRYVLFGGAALAFGLAILAFNFTMEYVALNGETPLTELPSFQSAVKRVTADDTFNWRFAPYRAWGTFLEEQFRSIHRMFLPYSVYRSLGYRGGDGTYDPLWLSESDSLGVVLGIVLFVVCLIGSMFVLPRILFVTLVSFGFFWALPFRHTTALHDFERMYYIGIPLVFFTIVLLLARRQTNRDGVVAAASVIALLFFAASSFQMSRIGYSAEEARITKEAEHDFSAMREVTAGEVVTVFHIGRDYEQFAFWSIVMNYYLKSSVIQYGNFPTVEGGFVVMPDRVDTEALLTPRNRRFFLYDRDGLEAWYEDVYRSVASTEALAREDFDVYYDDLTVYYLKEPCTIEDTGARFFLHVIPMDIDDLPDDRKQYGFDNFDFYFEERGLLFGGKCLVRFVLPEYAILKVSTGKSGESWSAEYYVNPPEIILDLESMASNEPAASSEFDLWIDGGKLYYLREPCARTDTEARFFLHVIPLDIDDLPDDRKQYGFDNLDFDWGQRGGVLFRGKCAAAVPLPQYGIERISTGQFDREGRVWGVEIDLDTNE